MHRIYKSNQALIVIEYTHLHLSIFYREKIHLIKIGETFLNVCYTEHKSYKSTVTGLIDSLRHAVGTPALYSVRHAAELQHYTC